MEDVKIKSLNFKSFKSLGDFKIDCTNKGRKLYQWTVLLGNNNTAKTNILRAIAGLRPEIYNNEFDVDPDKYCKSSSTCRSDKSKLNPYDTPDYSLSCNLTYSGLICDWGFSCIDLELFVDYPKIQQIDSTVANKDFYDSFKIYGYGVTRYTSQGGLSESICDDCASLFHPEERLTNLEEWLMQLDYASKNDKPIAKQRLEKIKELLHSDIFPEIEDFKFISTDKLHNQVLFKTNDGWFKYTQLGYGYQSMLSWVIDLCRRMFERYPNSDNPFAESAIVLIDEIDLHLHPKWQRNIISYLSKVFPNVQFIATTHSPLVIQSMKEVNLYVLERVDNDRITITRSETTNFLGWTVEEILREKMHLKDDVYSDFYNEKIRLFDEGLDNSNKRKAKKAYNDLMSILHPKNPVRRLLELQFSQMDCDD